MAMQKSGKFLKFPRWEQYAGEVKSGFECGINIKNFNDVKTGDVIETFEKREVAKKV